MKRGHVEFDLGSFTTSRSTHMGLQKSLELTHKLYLYGLWMLYTKFFNYWTTFFFFFQFRERMILKEKKKKKKAYGVLLLAINGQLFQEKMAWELVYTLVANLCYAWEPTYLWDRLKQFYKKFKKIHHCMICSYMTSICVTIWWRSHCLNMQCLTKNIKKSDDLLLRILKQNKIYMTKQ